MLSATESATCSFVITPATSPPRKDHRHDGVPAPHAPDDVKCGLVLGHQYEVSARDIAQGHAGMRRFKSAPQARVDANHAVDVAVSGDHNVTEPPGMLGLTQVVIETRLRRQNSRYRGP